MKQLLLFLAAVAVGSVASLESGLRVRFDFSLPPFKNSFYDIPRTIDDAIAQNWTMRPRPPSPYPELSMYCKECTLCTLYDHDTKHIAGLQVGLPMNDFTGAPYPWNEQGYIPWNPPACCGLYMTKQLYFISDRTLSKSVEERKQAALTKEVVQEKSIFVTGFDQQLMEIPTTVDEIQDAGFTKQACIPWMGLHHFFKMSSEIKCAAKTLLNWFPLTDKGKLIGIGFVAIGSLKKRNGQVFYYETPSKQIHKLIVVRGPKCLDKLAEDPKLTSMHIYFVDKPWKIGCPLF